jgi:hypothetical protein
MANDWILDVLSDLKAFAAENGLLALAGQLDETTLVAATEISSLEEQGQKLAGLDVGETGQNTRRVAAR